MHHNCLYFVMLLFSIVSSEQMILNTTQEKIMYKMIRGEKQYHEAFEKIAGLSNTVQVTKYSTHKQMCDGKPCRFYIYLHEPPKTHDTPNQNQEDFKNVLITSGIHGNQKIGPNALLYLYPLLQGHYRIIYFPIMNPSGYAKDIRETFPNKIDPNRDYPIDNNQNCYLASGTRIIDQIFRNYTIHLTINLHNGASQIGWNWGTLEKQNKSHTEDYEIYKNIGDMLYFYAGSNPRIGMKQMEIGTMSEAIYPVKGTLDDWVYAGSWGTSIPKKCKQYKYQPYPRDMHQGLMYLFQLGAHNVQESTFGSSDGLSLPPNSYDLSNGHVTRTLRMLTNLLQVVQISRQIDVKVDQNIVSIKFMGCRTVEQANFTLFSHGSLVDQIYAKNSEFLNPDINSFVNFINISPTKPLTSNFDLQIKYSLECDSSWLKKGATSFAKKRIFKGTIKQKREILSLDNSTQATGIPIQNPDFSKIAGKEIGEYQSVSIGKLFLIFCILILSITVLMKWMKNRKGVKMGSIHYWDKTTNQNLEEIEEQEKQDQDEVQKPEKESKKENINEEIQVKQESA